MQPYFDVIRELLAQAETQNVEALERAADVIAACMEHKGVLHTFGTGHGHILAEELFYRAGGLVAVNAILDPSLMLHVSALSSSHLERLPGYAELVLERYVINAGDVMLIASNSGRNSVPVEMAIAAKARGLMVIALTSLQHSRSQSSRHPSGKRLFEIADIVLDNCGMVGDAALEIEGIPGRIGATSTVIGAALLHALVYQAVQKMMANGIEPDITISANVDGSDAHNAPLFAQYRDRLRHL
ncbi:MAG: SIS domain-containing protein [Chloroflexota bacterium]